MARHLAPAQDIVVYDVDSGNMNTLTSGEGVRPDTRASETSGPERSRSSQAI